MKLQITLDLLDLDEAMSYLDEIHPYADILEIGTPLSMKYGFEAIRRIRSAYPELTILDDVKIVDGGKKLTTAVLQEDADIVTVLAVADEHTLQDAVRSAKQLHKKIMIDTIGIHNLEQKIPELDALGADYMSVHTGVDEQKRGITSIGKLRIMKKLVNQTKIAVAGGIGLNDDLDTYIDLQPDIIIVGNGIYSAENRVMTARLIHERLQTRHKV